MKPVLLAGETFFVTSTVAKGYDVGSSASLANGATRFIAALATAGITVSQIGGERCETEFPSTAEALQAFSAVVSARYGADGQILMASPYRGRSHPLLAVRDYGQGKTLAWMTDIGPHWLSQAFLNWDGYDAIMGRMVRWIAQDL